MSPAILLTLALVSATPRTLASPGLTSINIDERVAAFYSEFFAQELAVKSGFRVVTQAEVATLLGLERQRQLLGCSDDSTSCMAELAGALGAEGVVTGSIARLGSGFAVTLKVISPGDARTLAVRTGRSKDEDSLLDWLTETAGIVARQLKVAFAPASDAGTAAAVVPIDPEVPALPGNPRRIARNGKLFTEQETAKYFVARQRGLSETDAILEAKGMLPEPRAPEVGQRVAPDAGLSAPFVPAPLPHRVARGGKVLSDAQTKRYFEARAGGRSEAEAFAFALTTPVERAREALPVTQLPPPVVPRPPLPVVLDGGLRTLPAGLPRRIARDGKLLSEEETQRYFREKFKVP
jgi:hypothetical protein